MNSFNDNSFKSALSAIEIDKSTEVLKDNLRTDRQFSRFIDHLELNDKRLIALKAIIDNKVNERKQQAAKTEIVQTYRAKLVNLSKEIDMNYADIITYMANKESNKL